MEIFKKSHSLGFSINRFRKNSVLTLNFKIKFYKSFVKKISTVAEKTDITCTSTETHQSHKCLVFQKIRRVWVFQLIYLNKKIYKLETLNNL